MSARSALRSPKTLAAIFGASGVIHLVAPGIYETIVPRWMPRPRAVVYVSGLAELVCAAGLVAEAAWAGPLSAATLIGVWPANVQMAVDATRSHRPLAVQAGIWGRLPLQIPMIRMALRAGRRA